MEKPYIRKIKTSTIILWQPKNLGTQEFDTKVQLALNQEKIEPWFDLQCSEVLTSFDQKCVKTLDQKWMKATVNLSKVTKFWPQFDQTGVQSKKWIQLYQSSNSI